MEIIDDFMQLHIPRNRNVADDDGNLANMDGNEVCFCKK